MFTKEISEFTKNGLYDYTFDEGGNLIFSQTSKEFNQHYVSIPLVNYVYDSDKIKSFYNTQFTEFISFTNETSNEPIFNDELNQLTEENVSLKNQLSTLIEQSESNITESERLAIKQIILELRIQLKQGVIEKDFSEVFPYLPITKHKR